MKPTKEQLLSQYYGQNVLYFEGEGVRNLERLEVTWERLSWKHPFTKLGLRKLESITDEEAGHCAFLAGISIDNPNKVREGRSLLDYYLRRQSNVWGISWKYIFDYLISIGVALDFRGMTVEEQVEAGWIKLIEERNKRPITLNQFLKKQKQGF